MGGIGSGRRREARRNAEMADLRRRGWTLAEIGAHFGISRQAVNAALGRPPDPRPPCVKVPKPAPPSCPGCGAVLRRRRRAGPHSSALCLPCLASRPDASLAERLRAHRMASGLTCERLAAKAGVVASTITHYETGRRVPRSKTLARLAKALGRGILGGKGNRS
ncbi:MAG TPA: helix-turn-helix domain-containing protein [Gemmataceae bacterium]|nr:helix-turn-helix domain-containing protein [Gemmataceae bacterium]